MVWADGKVEPEPVPTVTVEAPPASAMPTGFVSRVSAGSASSSAILAVMSLLETPRRPVFRESRSPNTSTRSWTRSLNRSTETAFSARAQPQAPSSEKSPGAKDRSRSNSP